MENGNREPKGSKRDGNNAQVEKSLLIWGIHPVEEVLKVRPQSIEWVEVLPSFGRKKNQKFLLEKLKRENVLVRKVDDFHRRMLPKGAVHQGICARALVFWETSLDEIIDRAFSSRNTIVICDQIEDPQNLGALIRAAVAFFAAGIVIPQKQNAPINGTVVKASSGALFHARICTTKSIFSAIEEMQEKSIFTVGLDAKGETPIYRLGTRGPCCLVLGSESKGIRKNLKRRLDTLASIPINPVLDSLNVSNAASVALYELNKKKQ